MKETELRILDVGCVPVHETASHALSLKLDPVSPMPPVTLDLSGWGVPATGPTTQPAAPAEAADWWNAPTYTTDLIPPFQCAVTVSLSSGEVAVNGGMPATAPTAQPAMPATEAGDWWNAPTYGDDLIPPCRGAVTVTLSSGDTAAKAK